MLDDHTCIWRPDGHLERALSVELPAARLNAMWWMACHLAVTEDRAMARDYTEMTKVGLREEWKRRDPERCARLSEVSFKAYSGPRIIEALEKLDELAAQAERPDVQIPKAPEVQTSGSLSVPISGPPNTPQAPTEVCVLREQIERLEHREADLLVEIAKLKAELAKWHRVTLKDVDLTDPNEASSYIEELCNLNQRLLANEGSELHKQIARLEAEHQVELQRIKEVLSQKALALYGAYQRAGVPGVLELVVADVVRAA